MNPLLAVGLSAASALLFAAFSVLARKAMGATTAFAGAVISLLVGMPILGALALLFSDWRELTLEAAMWFALGGVLAPGVGRLLLFLGIRYIGVGRTMPLVTLTPFFSTLVAMAWLGERPGLLVWAATACVVGGCALLTMKPKGDADWRRIFILLPVAHALALAFASSTRRHALLLVADPILGAFIANAASLPAMLVLSPLLPREERFRVDRRGLARFIVSGVLNTLGFLLFFMAFRYGEVSIVVPLGYSAPLFALLFTKLWLREEERVTWQKWAGALSLFAGMVMIVWQAV